MDTHLHPLSSVRADCIHFTGGARATEAQQGLAQGTAAWAEGFLGTHGHKSLGCQLLPPSDSLDVYFNSG